LIPPEDVISTTSLSDQALVYMAIDALLHKFLVMGEAVHSEIIEHQIREMLSDKELSRSVTVKDERSGTMGTKYIWKQVIVSAVMSTTDNNLNPENVSRFFIVNADESREQTRRIHSQQRKKYTLDRYSAKACDIPLIVRKHHAAQRLLRKIGIVNPFSDEIRFPDMLMRTRRDHDRFVDLIACVCFLRQYQKETKTVTLPNGDEFAFIECDLAYYKIAYQIMKQVLPVTLLNFPQSAVRLYEEVRKAIKEKAKREGLDLFKTGVSQREVRERGEYNQRFVKRYMQVLCDYEFLRYQGMGMRGSKRIYGLVADEPIHQIDISMIATPEEMALKLQNIQSGP
jgi:DNA primase